MKALEWGHVRPKTPRGSLIARDRRSALGNVSSLIFGRDDPVAGSSDIEYPFEGLVLEVRCRKVK